ncbi:beta-ketoacyl-ACP synthase [Trichocoleus sp. ST-U3]|uniref:beta-ketoacyl-ACP synthase n=1 Tax=Coleofasciculus sp. FACHB-542 TaxID=2692787 RepID=UPI001683048F|nr:beta-ketoacyl-ACP synthase [Coleofasciculus sp. FACHB-542]
MEIVVTGIGLVSALGNSLQTSWQRLIAGQSGIQLHQPFPELAPRPLGLIGKQPAELATLTQRVVAMAQEDAGLVSPLPDCGVVIGSSRSYQASWEKLAREFYRDAEPVKSPLYKHLPTQAFLETLPHMNAIAAARQIGATGSVLAPMAACATGIWAIAQAASLLETGHCQQVIAGAVESSITPLTLAGFQQMGALAQTGAYPFDRWREGLALGEGGAVLVLESAELAKRRSARIYGQVLGFGLTSDAYHTNTPEPGSRSAIAAVKQCCDRSNLFPADIHYIHAHGTATQLNDQNEAHLIQYLFPQTVPVSSTKGATGHTLGASGALGVAFSLMALKHQILPPCVGLKEPEFDLDLVKVPRQGEIKQVLCFSFGFGGQNAVVALGKM